MKREGFDFYFDPAACGNCCGACCRGESGFIWVNKEEISKIARFLNIDIENFIKNYLKKVKYRFSLKEIKVAGENICIFFDLKSCRCEIYPVRPSQCVSYPFWDRYREEKHKNEVFEECPGVKRLL